MRLRLCPQMSMPPLMARAEVQGDSRLSLPRRCAPTHTATAGLGALLVAAAAAGPVLAKALPTLAQAPSAGCCLMEQCQAPPWYLLGAGLSLRSEEEEEVRHALIA
jgi:hypothetical protein